MNQKILGFVEKLEIFKTKIKALHWDSDNMSQHELCDKIADRIAEFQDQVSEVEQSISGKLPKNMFRPSNQNYGEVGTLKEFVENVLDATNKFYKELGGMGDNYIGMRSDCESFLSDMQRNLYLVNFTLKEDFKRRFKSKIAEGYRKEENIKTVFPGTKPSSDSGILKRLEAISSGKNGQFNSRTFDNMDDAFEFFKRNLEKVGILQSNGSVDGVEIVSLDASNGKSYKGMIDYVEVGDGRCKASIKFSNLGKESESNVEVNNSDYNELNMEGKEIKLSESELTSLIREATLNVLSETPLNYDIDNFSGRWSKGESDLDGYIDDEGYLDDPYKKDGIEYDLWQDAWDDGDDRSMKDIENDYSWDRFDNKAVAPGLDPYYNVGKGAIPREVGDAISYRNKSNDWSDRELRQGNRMMGKWVNGERDADQIGDAWEDLHFEGKEPMKVTESELKNIVKDAASRLIREHYIRCMNESIDIKPSKKGTFTAAATKHGKGVQEFADEVLSNREKYTPKMVKKANFAKNFGKKKK